MAGSEAALRAMGVVPVGVSGGAGSCGDGGKGGGSGTDINAVERGDPNLLMVQFSRRMIIAFLRVRPLM
eukprot:11214007-Karenia_brevis.AAC.1